MESFKIVSLGVNSLLSTRFPCYKGSLEVSCGNLFQILCDSSLDGGNIFETVTFQASLVLWEHKKGLPGSNRGFMVAAARLQPYPVQVGGHNVGCVGWNVVDVELPAIGNLRSFSFDGFVQASKDFFVEHGVDGLSQR